MPHSDQGEKLQAYYDGELSGGDRRGMEAHLQTCAECRAVIAEWKSLSKTFFQDPALSQDLTPAVMARVQNSPVVYGNREENGPVDPVWELLRRWWVQSLALAAAGWGLMVGLPAWREVPSTETLLLARSSADIPSEWWTAPTLSLGQSLSYLLGDL